MENLVSRRAYDASFDFSIRARLIIGILSGLFGGLFFGLFFTLVVKWVTSPVFPSPEGIFDVQMAMSVGIPFGIFMSLCMTLMWPAMFRKGMASFMDAVYANDPKIIDLPAAVEDFSHRLPCSWMKSDRFAVGGVLYLSRERFMFVPHKKNLPRHREPFEIAPLNNLKFSTVKPNNLLGRLLFKELPQHLEFTWSGGKTRFLVPEPEQTLMRIKGFAESADLN